MKTAQVLACGLLLTVALAGCNRPTVAVNGNSVLQHITIQADRVGANAPGGATAWIDATGALAIDGKDVDLSAEQRMLTSKYYTVAMGLRNDGVAVGKAGAAVAGKAVGSVIEGLASGNPDEIGKKIEAEANIVEAKAMQLCQRVGELQSAQDALAKSLPAFAPYATIGAKQVSSCSNDSKSATATDSNAASALIDAVDAQRIEEVRRLVEHGANIDSAVLGDGTALIRAAAHGDLAIVDELIRLGADVNQASRGDGNPLIAAAKRGHAEVVAQLVAAGADVNNVVAGDETPLINAARGGHLDVVTFLVEHGADVNKGVVADLGRWRSPLNQSANDQVRAYLTSKGAVADHKS